MTDNGGSTATRSGLRVAAVALAASLVGGAVGGAVGANAVAPPAASSAQASHVPQHAYSARVPDIAAQAARSVAEIRVRSEVGEETGSGIVVSTDGRILTNHHVVATTYGGEITVKLVGPAGPDSAVARVVATDPKNDLAVVQAEDLENLVPAKLGDSSKVRVGTPVVAIGSPQGLQGTVTAGIVSAVNRKLRVSDQPGVESSDSVTYKAIQTDAALHPGNSGGPLVSMLDGRVIAINSAIYATSARDDGSGLGFAIPINVAKPLLRHRR
ncbi:MAG TPA: trypsin-like peptidase domain-containing protein [Actinopolymorphaceae bacterium]